MQASLSESVSERIALVRVMCIAGMIYVHVPVPGEAALIIDAGDPLATLRAFLVEGFGRASAGLLSVVSGFLTARVLLSGRQSPRALYRRRFRSILVPMMIWGVATLAIYALVSLIRPTFLTETGSFVELLVEAANAVLFLTEMPDGPTMHLGFLRDLFVCVLLSPLLLYAIERAPVALFIALAGLYLFDIESVVILRPLILLCFATGLWLARRGVDVTVADAYAGWWAAATVAVTALILHYNADGLPGFARSFAAYGLDAKESVLYPLCRLCGSLTIWTLGARAVRSPGWRSLSALTPYLFVAYCSHYIVLTLAWYGLWLPLAGEHTGFLYTVWFLSAPALAFVAAWALILALRRHLPRLADVLTGGRGLRAV